jgi:transcriptional regulator with XRE-family HTH domain
MSNQEEISSLEIGSFLSQIREKAGMKQAELAKKIPWSPAMLSRIEVGERPLSSDELQIIAKAINTPEALRLSEVLQRQWQFLPRPPLNHGDQDILWSAEQTVQKLRLLSESPETKRSFQNRLEGYIEQIKNITERLLKRDHQIAFIGNIGMGKSTAICHLTNLVVPISNGVETVLEVGAGGVTICEAHLLTGAEYEIRIEPCSEDDIRAYVRDFARVLLGRTNDEENDIQGIAKEIERALRNMSGLIRSSKKDADGKTIRSDKAKELAQQHSEEGELIIEIVSRLKLHKRNSRSELYQSSTGKPPLKWLKDTFELINNGRHADFSLPKRIEVVVRESLLPHNECSVRIIDTKGIDNQETAARPDLENHLRDPHTLTVLCSGFLDAPNRNAYQLLERANEINVPNLSINTSLVILARSGEALAVRDDSGLKVESDTEGYELKQEQIETALQPLNLQQLPIHFFNAYQDDVNGLRYFLSERLSVVRNTFRKELNESISDAETLLENQEQEQIRETIRSAGKRILSWLEQHQDLPPIQYHVYDSLIGEMKSVHPRSLSASIWRNGKWVNFSYEHHLAYGSQLFSHQLLKETISHFEDFCRTLNGDAEYADAENFIKQTNYILNFAVQRLFRKTEQTGKDYFVEALASASGSSLWQACQNEWGRGYRDRVIEHNINWFNTEPAKMLEQKLYELIKHEWKNALNKVSDLIDVD